MLVDTIIRDGLSPEEIRNILKRIPDNVTICNMNMLWKQHISNGYTIVNVGSNDSSGHWVCIYKNNNLLIYFDSFGIEAVEQDVISYMLRTRCGSYEYSTQPIQSPPSTFCGLFVCAFVLSVQGSVTYHNFLSLFNHNDLNLNEYAVLDIIDGLLG